MKKVIIGIGLVFVALVGLFVVLLLVVFTIGNRRLTKTYKFPTSDIIVPTDTASIEHGQHLAAIICAGCHGPDMGGITRWFNPRPFGTVDSANLTSGEGGIGKEFTRDEDYVLAIRHGVNPQGKPLYMPAVMAFQNLSDEDLGAIIAYLKTLPPVNRKTNGQNFNFLGKIMLGVGGFGKLPVEAVSHALHVTAPGAGATVDYGGYLVAIGDCRACHGENLAGGKFPDPAVKITVPSLTPDGVLGGWTGDDFLNAMKTGITPEGKTLDPMLMPWRDLSQATDEELQAIWLYLQSLPKGDSSSG